MVQTPELREASTSLFSRTTVQTVGQVRDGNLFRQAHASVEQQLGCPQAHAIAETSKVSRISIPVNVVLLN